MLFYSIYSIPAGIRLSFTSKIILPGSQNSHCQWILEWMEKDNLFHCRQEWDHLARYARHAQLIRSRRMMETHPTVPTLIRDGSVGTAHNSCQIDIGCQLL